MKTNYKLFKFALVALLAIVVVGCDDESNQSAETGIGELRITYYPREVNYSLVQNKYQYSNYNYSYASYSNTEIEASEYLLYASTCNVFTVSYSDTETCDYLYFQRPDYYDEWSMTDDSNYEIEAIFDDLYLYYEYEITDGEGMPSPYDVDYRTSALTGLNITCDTELFGVEAGGSLNDYLYIFSIDYTDLGYHLFSIDNELITASLSDMCGMSIEEYLAVSPYAPVNITFGFNEPPTNLPQTVTFTVDMEIDGTRIVSNTSDPITLI